jgi:hypothetical protein
LITGFLLCFFFWQMCYSVLSSFRSWVLAVQGSPWMWVFLGSLIEFISSLLCLLEIFTVWSWVVEY